MLDRKDGMITVDDGIRRLRLLDAKGKVWTQEMLLQVEEKSVSLIDQETKVRLDLGTRIRWKQIKYHTLTVGFHTFSLACDPCLPHCEFPSDMSGLAFSE